MDTHSNPILVVAALSLELDHLRDDLPVNVELLETGEGIENARKKLEAWLAAHRARAVLSIGFAGGLADSLSAGDLVIARSVHQSSYSPDPVLFEAAQMTASNFPRVSVGDAITSERILWQSEQKKDLAKTLAPDSRGFVDMESSAIATVCMANDLPLLVIRSITDLLGEDLPLDFNLHRDSEGRIDTKRVLAAAIFKPRTIAGLIELKKRSELCAQRMASFVTSLIRLIPR